MYDKNIPLSNVVGAFVNLERPSSRSLLHVVVNPREVAK